MTAEEKKQNREKALSIIIEAGQTLEPYFTLKPDQEEYYLNLYAYFLRKPRTFDVNKGLLILGDIGTGKTLSFHVMRKIFGGFNLINTRYVVRDFFASNPNTLIIDKYGRESFKRVNNDAFDYNQPLHWCFDDFGLESVNVKVYGNVSNVMEEIIHDRYENYLKHGMLTFATSNLDASQLEACYGQRTTDRLRQMMNVHALTGESLRK